ncbi:hypothetical protein HU200_001697 [Digitaria exilis]|uniref:DUF4057 domain-containing protein n=1 Tax=Digitaria exilis TaxID=1010633 RepID=A0A835FWW8_9POAL|nr:hypothetical protein HU200_001697 [Digitaria exilis]
MERASPVRSSHTSTAGLLAWPHPDGAGPLPARRPNQVPPALDLSSSPVDLPPSVRAARRRRRRRFRSWSSILSPDRLLCSQRRSSGRWCSEARAPRMPTPTKTLCRLADSDAAPLIVPGRSGRRSRGAASSRPRRPPPPPQQPLAIVRCATFGSASCEEWNIDWHSSSILGTHCECTWRVGQPDHFCSGRGIAPRKPTSVAEVARHRELSHTVQSEADSKTKRQVSTAKSKELSGHDIFADHEDPKPNRSRRSDYSSSTSLSPVKNANVSTFSFGEADTDSAAKTARKKGTGKKTTDLNGKALLQREPAPVVKPLNRAKLEETTGSSVVFADGKAPATGEQAGRRTTRQPPGGDSRISLG